MIEIAPLSASDFTDWQPLWGSYLCFYEAHVSDEVSALSFKRLTSLTEPMGGFIARDRVSAVGIVHWITHRSCWTLGDYCYLQDLFVTENVRGQGIGRKLIEAVYEKAVSLKCSRVYWLTHETNATAMRLYDRIADRSGFIQYRRIFG